MERGRYYLGLILGAVVCVGVTVYTRSTDFAENLLYALLLGYCFASLVCELIWWDLLPMVIFRFIASLALIPIKFAFALIAGGGLLGIIIGLVLITPTLSILGAGLGLALSVAIPICFFMCPIHIFTLRNSVF